MIVVPAFHPCHEIVALVGDLVPGTVARIDRMLVDIGGKSTNVARALARVGAPVRLVALADARLAAALRQDEILGAINPVIVPSPVPSRTDVAIVDRRGEVTVLNARAADPGRAAIGAVLENMLAGLGSGDVVVLSGSLPAGADGTIAQAITAARQVGARVALDASGEGLAEGLAATPDVLKVAANELASVVGISSDEAVARARQLVPAVGLLVVTDGPRGLRAWPDNAFEPMIVRPPQVTVVNPLGAGDAIMAGLVAGLAAGEDILLALVDATAMAASTVERLDTAIDPARASQLRARVTVSRAGDRSGR
jgi:1-phosphofructokinase